MSVITPETELEARNVRVVRRFVDEVLNAGHLERIDELWAVDLDWHAGSLGEIHGIDGFKQNSANAAGALSGMHLTIDDLVARDDKVVIRFTNSGTHIGTFLGAAATGRHVRWLGIGIYTLRENKIIDAWFGEDMLGLLMAVGAFPAPGMDAG